MKLRAFSKRIFSLVLCLVMVASCWVFTAPTTAVAESAYPDSYDVAFTFELTDGVSHTDFINDAYIRLTYLKGNGYSEEEESVTFSFKENYADYLNDANQNIEKQVVFEDVPGFPTSVEIYLKNSNRFLAVYDGASYHVYDMSVNGTQIWTGDMYVQTQGAQRQVVLYYNGDWSRNTGSETGKESECYCALSTEDTDYTNYHTVHNWVNLFPYADSIAFTDGSDSVWNSSYTIVSDSSTFTPKSNTVCLDQYGVVLPAAEKMQKIAEYNGESFSPLATAAGDIQMNSTTGTVSAAAGGYIAGGNAAHTLKTKLRYDFGEIYKTDDNGELLVDDNDMFIVDHTVFVASDTFETTLIYPEKSVTWNYKLSSNDAVSGDWDSVTSTCLFGDSVTDADFPGTAANRNYYTSAAHFENGQYPTTRINDDMAVNMVDYTQGEHSFTLYVPIEGNEENHKFACACGYGVEQAHVWDDGEITKSATCKEEGILTYTCTLCGAHKEEAIEKVQNHVWNDGEITTQPTCEDTGVLTYTCTICGDTYTKMLSALGHKVVTQSITDVNGNPAGVYFTCQRGCGCYWAAAYNESKDKYYIADETEYADAEAALAASTVPASHFADVSPVFNTFYDSDSKQDYSTRGASLRFVEQKVPVSQPLRFMASVRVPENVSFQIGAEGNAISDVGFVYSQKQIIGEDKDSLKLGSDKEVYSMSVKARNESSGVYNGSNWGGVSRHEDAAGTYLTFNIVIPVKYGHWTLDYVARSYVKYNYNGFEYTVYDDSYSCRSVEYVARRVVASSTESQAAKNYCQTTILDNID